MNGVQDHVSRTMWTKICENYYYVYNLHYPS